MSQRDLSPDGPRGLRASSRKPRPAEDAEDDWKASSTSNHPSVVSSDQSRRVESPLDQILGSIRHSRARNQSPISPLAVDSVYGSGRGGSHGPCDLSDPPSDPPRLHYPQNPHCQASYLHEGEYRHCTTDGRSNSPTSSSDEVLTRHPRHRQHSSHRHRFASKEEARSHAFQAAPGPHRQVCHRYHEIEAVSCSPVCDSGIRDDASSSSNHRDRLSSEEDGPMCSLAIANTAATTVSNALLSPLSMVTAASYHHRASSGVSCDSSPSVRNHATLENCVTERQHRQPPRHNHVIQSYALDHPQRVQIVHARETKSPLLIGLDAIQISNAPSKSKCQCHVEAQQHEFQLHQQTHQQDQLHQQHQQSAQALHHHHHHYHQHQQYASDDKRAEGEGTDDGMTVVTTRMHQPPALPPRPPPRANRRYEASAYDRADNGAGGCCKKYVVLCCLCGGLSTAVGSLFLAVHAVLSAHTTSLTRFETVPSYIPGVMLIMMGMLTMLLARRKHRYGILMKVCGSVGVVCALVCVLVTVTTTVVHMSTLQGLRECVYTARARSCTCYGVSQGREGDPGVLFEGIPNCEAVHGVLYACLRALFGVSVAGILACIFSCMLVYQLLSHEKKKMYWEQLELRCRSLYGHGGSAPVGGAASGSCGCCNDCGGVNPWWAQTPGNLYTPNPDLAPSRRWRLPWSRSRGPAPSPDSNYGFHAQSMRHASEVNDPTRENPSTVSTHYGLLDPRQQAVPYSGLSTQNVSYPASTASYSVLETPVPLWGPPPPYSDPNSPARCPQVEPATPTASPSQPSARTSAKRIDSDTNFHTQPLSQGNKNSHLAEMHSRMPDNYENSEEMSNDADEGMTTKGRRSRRALKGVENDAFQKDSNQQPKQSESELYFGDVSSCCGPDSSLYELAVDKDPDAQQDYSPRQAKQRLSKRAQQPQPDRSYSDKAAAPFLAPDAQYEVIAQGARYGYYAKDDEFCEAPAGYLLKDPDGTEAEDDPPKAEHRSSGANESEWQPDKPDDGVCPINV